MDEAESRKPESVRPDIRPDSSAEEPLPAPMEEPMAQQVPEAEENIVRTILDYLNEDCWRKILDYVPVRDIIRTESASQGWQAVMLVYLKYIRFNIEIETRWSRDIEPLPNVHTFILRQNYKSLNAWTKKLGSSVVSSCCNNKRMLRILRGNCPNIESLMFMELKPSTLKNQKNRFKKLKRLGFVDCIVSDRSISQFIATNNVLEEFGIYSNNYLDGQCLTDVKSPSLKTLILEECMNLSFEHLLAAAVGLRGLKKLDLYTIPRGVYDNIHLVLNCMSELQDLKIRSAIDEDSRKKNVQFIEAVCQLKRLKHLTMYGEATDADIEAMARSCTQLTRLALMHCPVTGRGVAALCRHAGARLTALGFACCCSIRDDDVVLAITECPHLMLLDLRVCSELTPELLARAAAARRGGGARPPLRLHVGDTSLWNEFNPQTNPRYRSRCSKAYFLDQLCLLSTCGLLNSAFSLFVLLMLMEAIIDCKTLWLYQLYDVWYGVVVASVAASVARRNREPLTSSVTVGFLMDFLSYLDHWKWPSLRHLRVCCYFIRVHRPLRFIWAKTRDNMSSSILVTVLKYVYYTFLLRITCAYLWIVISSLELPLTNHDLSQRHIVHTALPLSSDSDSEAVARVAAATSVGAAQFGRALYFINKIFIPIGPSINPETDFDRVLFLLVMMMGTLLVAGAAVAALSSVISVYMRADEDFWTRYRIIIRNLTKSSEIPESLRTKVETYYKMYWHKQRAVSATQLLPSFPPVLAKSVYTDIYFPAMQKSGPLRDLPYHFLSDVAQNMETILYVPGEPIIKRNSRKDSLIFIAYGDIEMLTAEDDHSAMLRFTRGTALSPRALCAAEGCGARAHVCVRAATFCAAHRLPARTVWRVATTRVGVAGKMRAAFERADGTLTDDSDAICLRPTFPCILQPTSSLLTAWNWLVATLIIALCFTYPYYLVYKKTVPLDFWFFDMTVAVVFVLDIVAYLSTGENVEDGVPITFLQTSCQQIKSLWFVVDVVATIFKGMWRIARFHKAIRVIKSLEEKWVYHSNVIRFIRYAVILILFCYLLAAFQHEFLCTGYNYCLVTNFTYPPFWSRGPLDDETVEDRLYFSLYWAISVLTFTSHMDVIAAVGTTVGVAVYTMTLEACIVLHIFIEAVYSATIMVTTAFRENYDSCIADVRYFLIRHKVPPQLRQRFLDHLQLCWNTEKAYSMTSQQNNVFYELPTHVYHDILARQRSKYILSIPFMKFLHKEDLTRISSKARLFYTAPQEILLNTGDVITEMYVIKQGFCEVLNPDTGEVVAMLVAKNNFGVLECLFRLPTYYTVRAATHVQVFSISRKHVAQALETRQIKDAIKFVMEQEEYSRLQVKREPFVTYQPPTLAPTRECFRLLRKHEKDEAFIQPFTKLGLFSILRHVLPRFTFRPDSELLARYEVCRAFCAIACAFVFPSYTYLVLQFPWLYHAAVVLDLCANLDIIFRMLVAYFDANGILVYHPASTVAHYLRGAFCMDLFSCTPLEGLESSWKHTNEDGKLYQVTAMKQILMMNRLLQLYRLPGTLEVLTSRIQRRNIILVLQALPLFLTMLNVLTSLLVFSSVRVYHSMDQQQWEFVPTEDKGGSWIQLFSNAYRFNVTASPWNLHISCYFWIVYQATTTGYNTLAPTNLYIMAVLFGAMVFGSLIVIYISVRIISIRANVNSTLATYQEHMKDLQQFMWREKLDKHLQMEMIDYYKLNWKKTGGVDALNVLKLCDQITLRTDAILHLYGPAFAKCPILADCDASLLRVLGRAVRVIYFLRGTTIFQEDDVIDHLYIVYSGELGVRTTNWEDGACVATKLTSGSMVGNLDNTRGSRVRSGLAATTDVHLLQMSSVAFHNIVGYCDDRVHQLMAKYRVNDQPYIRADVAGSWLLRTEELSSKEVAIQSCLVQVFLIMVSLLTIYADVYNAGFQDNRPSVIAALYVLDSFFLIKFLLYFMMPELVTLTLATEEAEDVNIVTYFKSAEFKYDVASCVPLELLAFLDDEPWLLASWLRLNRLLRVKTVIKYLKRYEKRATENLVLNSLALVMWFTVYVHCGACMWFFVGWTVNRERPRTSWFYDDNGNGICRDEYFCSIYFILTSFAMNGVNDVMPKHQIEVVYASLFLIASTMVFVVYVGEFSNIVHYASFRAFSYYSKVLELQKFLKTNRVSPVLVDLVKKYSVLLWRETRGEQLPAFLVNAPLCLKLKVMSHAYMAEAQRHPVFQHCEPALLRQVIGHLRQYYYDEYMYVARQDEITNSMYFVHTGEVQEIRQSDVEGKGPAGGKPILHAAGEHFGVEQGLIRDKPFQYSYRTTIKSQILMLCFDDWEYLLNYFPDSKQVINSYQWTSRDDDDDDDQAAEKKKVPRTGRLDTIVSLGDPDEAQNITLGSLHPEIQPVIIHGKTRDDLSAERRGEVSTDIGESTVRSARVTQGVPRANDVVPTPEKSSSKDASKELFTGQLKSVGWAPREKEIFETTSEHIEESFILDDDSTHLFDRIHNAALAVDTTITDDNEATSQSSPDSEDSEKFTVSVPYQSVEEYIASKYQMRESYAVNKFDTKRTYENIDDNALVMGFRRNPFKYSHTVDEHQVREYRLMQPAETIPGDVAQQISRGSTLNLERPLSSLILSDEAESYGPESDSPNSESHLFMETTSSIAIQRDSSPLEQDESQVPTSSKQASRLNESSDDNISYDTQRRVHTSGVKAASKTRVVDFDSDAAALMNTVPKRTDTLEQKQNSLDKTDKPEIVGEKRFDKNFKAIPDARTSGTSIKIDYPGIVIKDFDSDVAAQMATVADSTTEAENHETREETSVPPTLELLQLSPKEDATDLEALPIEPKEIHRKARRSTKQTVQQLSQTDPKDTQLSKELGLETKQISNDPPDTTTSSDAGKLDQNESDEDTRNSDQNKSSGEKRKEKQD